MEPIIKYGFPNDRCSGGSSGYRDDNGDMVWTEKNDDEKEEKSRREEEKAQGTK